MDCPLSLRHGSLRNQAMYHLRLVPNLSNLSSAAYHQGMDPSSAWPTVAVMGAGAVGCYFGGMLARAGAPVTLIARPLHVDAITRSGLRIESQQFDEHIAVRAAIELDPVRDAQIVFVSVKTPDTESAAQALAPLLRDDALIVGLQNGVDNAPRMRSHVRQPVVPAVVYVAAEMAGPGHVRHTGRGDLVVGPDAGASGDPRQSIDRVAALCARGGVPCRVSDDVDVELWAKLTMNCAYNGMSALTRMKYGPLAASVPGRALLDELTRETVAVARSSGVPLDEAEMLAAVFRLADAMPEATSSTAQDITRGHETEIDELNGFVARRGEAFGVPTPVNRTVHALVKLLEGRTDRPDDPPSAPVRHSRV